MNMKLLTKWSVLKSSQNISSKSLHGLQVNLSLPLQGLLVCAK
jgi:hypothetical protein